MMMNIYLKDQKKVRLSFENRGHMNLRAQRRGNLILDIFVSFFFLLYDIYRDTHHYLLIPCFTFHFDANWLTNW